MLKKVLATLFRCFGIFFAGALLVYLATRGDYHFHTSSVEMLDNEMLRSSTHYSYYQYYEVHTPLQFRLDIQSEQLGKRAVVVWPKEPYTKILILSTRADDAINSETVFKGRLINCFYKCIASGMPIVMDDFVEMITESLPQYKDKEENRKLPVLIFDTLDVPKGFWHYVELKKFHFMALGATFLLGIGLLVWDLVKKFRAKTL